MQPINTQASKTKVKPAKVIVAVHGIGDQFQFATIQSVANQFSAFSAIPQPLPLGKFYDQPIGTPPEIAYLLQMQLDKIDNEQFGFVEIYWADIPRIPEKEGYTLEESKKWGKTVVDRLRPYCKDDPKTLQPADLEMAKALLEEILETLSVVERLLLIAEKAGLFKFNLQEILINYLGDVQLVTDFKKYRDKILHRFFEVMNYIRRFNPDAEIYIVAHSEGTVVAFLSLLQAVAATLDPSNNTVPVDIVEETKHVPPLDCDWLKQVKGLMTIGSPIDKHLIFWPDLWKAFEELPKDQASMSLLPDHKIPWRNYYDYGDPIGFELDTAREWLCDNKLDRVFEFPKSSDHGFGRYPLPGKAHNDYWQDAEVFDHFIKTVIKEAPPSAKEKTRMCAKNASANNPNDPPPPGNRNLWRFLCNVLPYGIVIGLLYLAVYLLYKAANEYRDIDPHVSAGIVFRNISGIVGLLIGLTMMAQIPRLTRVWKWRLAAIVVFVLSIVGYRYLPSCQVRSELGCFLVKVAPFLQSPTRATVALASLIAVVVFVVGLRLPRAGLKTLLWSSVIGLAVTLGANLFFPTATTCKCPAPDVAASTGNARALPEASDTAEAGAEHHVWPLFLATAAFLYLWWLAALMFDLVVVWHYYIRRSVAMDRLRTFRNNQRTKSGAIQSASGGERPSRPTDSSGNMALEA